MTTWKSAERQIAKILGGARVPVSGRGRGDAPDIAHPTFAVEVKHRKAIPDWLKDAIAQAEAARRGAQIPLVVLHEKGQDYEKSLAIIRLCDLITLLEEP